MFPMTYTTILQCFGKKTVVLNTTKLCVFMKKSCADVNGPKQRQHIRPRSFKRWRWMPQGQKSATAKCCCEVYSYFRVNNDSFDLLAVT